MLTKLRPVGSRVYPPARGQLPDWPRRGEWLSCYTSSGTAALSLAMALACRHRAVAGVPQVILPAYGCPDLVAAVVAQGALPVLVDLAPNAPFMDLEALGKAVTRNTVAIVAVDFLGLPERLEAISTIAREQGLLLIEDSAQRFPPACLEQSFADCAVLSFGRGKPINLMGGGALLVHEALGQRLKEVSRGLATASRRYGLRERIKRHLFNGLLSRRCYFWLERMPFLGLGQTRYKPLIDYALCDPPQALLAGGIEAFAKRPDWAKRYDEALGFLESQGWLCLSLHWRCEATARASSGYPLLRYPLLAPDQPLRDRALALLNAVGIGANAFYGAALPATAGTAEVLGEAAGRAYPRAESFASRLITLPCHEDTRLADIQRIARVLGELVGAPLASDRG